MNHELAKKLEDAGFPQKHDYRVTIWGFKAIEKDMMCTKCASIYGRDVEACRPTLLELIEACGTELSGLSVLGEEGKFQWCATGKDEESRYGSTPDIAVSNLWFKLREDRLRREKEKKEKEEQENNGL
jgi:hypothetical protein